MNTNRGSYLLGAALGTAFVLALSPNAMAGEDIYQPSLKGGYDVPPPPPSDRGLYFKAYMGQANTNVGSIWTPGYETNTFSVFHHDIKSNALYGFGIGYKRNHWLRFDLTGEYRGDTTFLAQDCLSWRRLAFRTVARTSTRPTSRPGSVSPTPIGTSPPGAGSRPTSAPASASPTSRSTA